jgi:hypothetical protein
MPIIPTLRRLRQKDSAFKSSLDYIARFCLKKTNIKKGKKKKELVFSFPHTHTPRKVMVGHTQEVGPGQGPTIAGILFSDLQPPEP